MQPERNKQLQYKQGRASQGSRATVRTAQIFPGISWSRVLPGLQAMHTEGERGTQRLPREQFCPVSHIRSTQSLKGLFPSPWSTCSHFFIFTSMQVQIQVLGRIHRPLFSKFRFNPQWILVVGLSPWLSRPGRAAVSGSVGILFCWSQVAEGLWQ